MAIKAFRLTVERYIEPCQLDDVVGRANHDSECWIDLCPDGTESLAELLKSFGLHPLAVDACLDVSPISGLSSYGKSIVICLPTHAAWDAQDREFFFVVCLPRLIVTLHTAEVPALTHILRQYTDAIQFHGANTSAILYQILDHLIDSDLGFTRQAREEIDRLDELMETHSGDSLSEDTLPLKRQLTRLAATFEDQWFCVESLQAIESQSFHVEGLQDYFRDAVSHLEHASRSAARQIEHLNTMHQENQLKLQGRTNDRLRLLTVISTIFIPLTAIAGIYGMNFRNMPELQWPYAYFAVLGFMGITALAMLWGFYRTGWFR